MGKIEWKLEKHLTWQFDTKKLRKKERTITTILFYIIFSNFAMQAEGRLAKGAKSTFKVAYFSHHKYSYHFNGLVTLENISRGFS